MKKYNAEIEVRVNTDNWGGFHSSGIDITLNSIYDENSKLIQEFENLELSNFICAE